MASTHRQIAFSIVTCNANVLLDDEPLDNLIIDIADALQDAFDLGFKAAGGSIHPIVAGPVGGMATVTPENRGDLILHASDCAIHNAPALPVGDCDCGADPK